MPLTKLIASDHADIGQSEQLHTVISVFVFSQLNWPHQSIVGKACNFASRQHTMSKIASQAASHTHHNKSAFSVVMSND